MKLREILKQGADTLERAGVAEPELDAWYLLSYCMGITKPQYYMMQDETVCEADCRRYHELIVIRSKRRPLQYITGFQEFMGLDFIVNDNVLIPRQDTEVLVELAIEHVKGKTVLDMCTGSGCIAVSIACMGEPKSVCASDISGKAIETAVRNAANNNAEVRFVRSDIWDDINEKFDVIISNPPYVTEKEMESLMPEVREHEPGIALYGGKDGLDIYRRIIDGAPEHLNDRGCIFFETGCRQAGQVLSLLEGGGFADINICRDLAGLDRVVWGRLK